VHDPIGTQTAKGKNSRRDGSHEKGMSVLEGFLRKKKKPLDGGVNKSTTMMVFRRTAFGGQTWRQFLPGFLCARTIRLERFDSPLPIAPSSEDFRFRHSIYRAIWMSASKPRTFQAQRRHWSEALASHDRHAGANHPLRKVAFWDQECVKHLKLTGITADRSEKHAGRKHSYCVA
jgi:hypothetical protein